MSVNKQVLPVNCPEKRLLRGEEVAQILNCSKAFAFQLIRQGRIPAVHLGRAVRVRSEDLDSFIEASVK